MLRTKSDEKLKRLVPLIYLWVYFSYETIFKDEGKFKAVNGLKVCKFHIQYDYYENVKLCDRYQ